MKKKELIDLVNNSCLYSFYDVERYISCNVNLKELTFDWLIDEIGIHIAENDFNKEYLKL